MSLIASLAPGHGLGMSFVRALAFLSMGSAATGVFAAQLDEEPAVLRVGTQLVQVNVVVSGDDGPVHDLTVDDFTVLDDGVERVIEVFDIIRSETAELDSVSILPDGVASNRLDRRGRRPESATIVLIDRLNTPGPDQAFMDYQVRAFLDDAAAAGEHVAVLELGAGGLTMLADFIDQPSVVRNALETRRPSHSLAMESSLGYFTGGLDPVLAELVGESNDEEGTGPFTGEPDPGPAERAGLSVDVGDVEEIPPELSRLIERYYMDRRVLLTAAALEASARHLSPLPGRKNLVWIAAQFPFPYKPWRDRRFNIVSRTPLPTSTLDRIEDVFRVIVDSDVAVYPIDALGLRGVSFSRFGETRDLASDLNLTIDLPMKIAEVTGGRASFNTNGLTRSMREAVRDTKSNYSLGFYVPEVASDTEFHPLEVRVDREDVDVLHRSGYYGFGASPSDAREVSEALASPFGAAGIGLLAAAEPIPDEPGRFRVTLAVDVNDIDLTREADHWAGSLAIAMSFYTPSLDEYTNRPAVVYAVRLTEAQFAAAQQLMNLIVPYVVETDGLSGHLRVAVHDPATGATVSLWVPLGRE